MRTYSASLDNLSKGISVFVFVLFGAIISLQLNTYIRADQDLPAWSIILMGGIFLLIIATTWIFRPVKYSVNSERLIIHRPVRDVEIRIRDIRKAVRISKDDMRWTARTFGNGGLFGYYGKFWNKKFGTMTWYATKRNNYLLVETREGKKLVLTPDDVQLEQEIQKYLRERA